MAVLDFDDTLTQDDGFKETIAKTHKGMAHFAGTGPAGKHCKDCPYWGLPGARYESVGGFKQPKPRPCAMFKKLARNPKTLPKVPGTAKACKYITEGQG